jgi:hypothetical protein
MKLLRPSLFQILWVLGTTITSLLNPAKHPHPNAADQQPEGAATNTSGTQPSAYDEQWHKEQAIYWKRQLRISRWLNWITAVGTVAAISALVFLYFQMQASQITAQTAIDQLRMTKTSLQTTERAWISIKGVTLERPIAPNEEAPVKAGFETPVVLRPCR